MNATLWLSLALAGAGQSQADADLRAKLDAGWRRLCLDYASEYRIYPAGKAQQRFRILPKPVFHHVQSSRGHGGDVGAVCLWLQNDGRPGAIALFHAFPGSKGDARNRRTKHVFHSLADAPLTAIWRGRTRWSPATAGLEWKPIPGAPLPAETAQERLRQIRFLARPVKAHSLDKEDGRWELRLLPRPLYHYDETDDGSTLGGAVLGICQGVSVQIVLCIETRQTDDGYRWYYAFAPFTDYRLYAQLGDAEPWRADGSRRKPSDTLWRSVSIMTKLPERYLENDSESEDPN